MPKLAECAATNTSTYTYVYAKKLRKNPKYTRTTYQKKSVKVECDITQCNCRNSNYNRRHNLRSERVGEKKAEEIVLLVEQASDDAFRGITSAKV